MIEEMQRAKDDLRKQYQEYKTAVSNQSNNGELAAKQLLYGCARSNFIQKYMLKEKAESWGIPMEDAHAYNDYKVKLEWEN
jgi:hypothetical protein